MLTGIVIGIILSLLAFAVIFLLGQNATYRSQVKVLAKEQAFAEAQVQNLAATVQQERQKSITFNLTEEQVTTLAGKISARVQTMMEAANEAALRKMN